MKTSKTRIDRKMRTKTNAELVETIRTAKRGKWVDISNLVSIPRRKKYSVNLDQIDEKSKEGDTVLVPGKVLGTGEVTKKLRIVAFSFSESARQKLKEKKCEMATILEEIKVNPKAEGIRILK